MNLYDESTCLESVNCSSQQNWLLLWTTFLDISQEPIKIKRVCKLLQVSRSQYKQVKCVRKLTGKGWLPNAITWTKK